MSRSNWIGQVDFASKVIFAYPQEDGSLLISIEEYDATNTSRRVKSTDSLEKPDG